MSLPPRPALVLLNTALRIGECAALDADDVAVSARNGRVIVRVGRAMPMVRWL